MVLTPPKLWLFLFWRWFSTIVYAWAPAHPTFEEWEPLDVLRRRTRRLQGNNGLSNHDDLYYRPQHIVPDQCRYLTDEQCQSLDEQSGRRRRLNPSTGGNLKVMVLLLEFRDNTHTLPDKSVYETILNGQGSSLKEWLSVNSHGRYNVTFNVQPWRKLPGTEADYAAGTSGSSEDLQLMFGDILDELDQSGEIDWFDGYADPDGMLNHFIVLHSGLVAEVGDRPCVPGSHRDRLWSNGSEKPMHPDTTWTSLDYFQLNGWLLTSAFGPPVCQRDDPTVLMELQPTELGVMAHEYCHGFGLPDLYDQSNSPVGIAGVGKFDIMASIQGWGFSGNVPGHLGAYSRAKVGWVEPQTIVQDGYYVVQPLEVTQNLFKISHGFPEGEYLLLENKQPLKFDSDVNQGGMVVYHVDEAMSRQDNPSYPGGPEWPTRHYRVAVVQADRLFQIEKGENIGDVGDFWVKGTGLYPGGEQPNTNAYQNGRNQRTDLTIEFLTPSTYFMVIHVRGMGAGRPPSAETDSTTGGGEDRTIAIPVENPEIYLNGAHAVVPPPPPLKENFPVKNHDETSTERDPVVATDEYDFRDDIEAVNNIITETEDTKEVEGNAQEEKQNEVKGDLSTSSVISDLNDEPVVATEQTATEPSRENVEDERSSAGSVYSSFWAALLLVLCSCLN